MQYSDETANNKGPALTKWLWPALAVVLCGTTVLAWIGRSSERARSAELAASNQALTASLANTQRQMDAMSQKLNAMSEVQQAAQAASGGPSSAPAEEPPQAAVPAKQRAAAHRAPAKPKPQAPMQDPRVDQLQARLSDQEKALASTREQIDKNRQDLEGQIGSTKDELNGSIARTHEELVELRKRGERNFYEFDLSKSKDFRKVGPMGLSLRKVNTKKKNFDMMLMVDDQQLQKKSVNLYEPVLISTPDTPQPLQLVINEISKDRVKGYLSEPKYRKAQVASSTDPAEKPAALQSR